jgi:hypothetical protein
VPCSEDVGDTVSHLVQATNRVRTLWVIVAFGEMNKMDPQD